LATLEDERIAVIEGQALSPTIVNELQLSYMRSATKGAKPSGVCGGIRSEQVGGRRHLTFNYGVRRELMQYCFEKDKQIPPSS
jgi:hypothetical protein